MYLEEERPVHPYYDVIVSRLHKAFEELTYIGFLAFPNFACCTSCAGYELTCMAIKLIQSKERTKEPGPKQIKGCIYWHAQNDECLREYGTVYLGYGDMESVELGRIGWDSGKAGVLIMEVLEKHGLIVRWNGDGETKIKVVGYRHTIVPGIVENRLSKSAKV